MLTKLAQAVVLVSQRFERPMRLVRALTFVPAVPARYARRKGLGMSQSMMLRVYRVYPASAVKRVRVVQRARIHTGGIPEGS
jgi:hypothetical protein